jgi:hypothetical protein
MKSTDIRLLERWFSRESPPNLGIEGFGPENPALASSE